MPNGPTKMLDNKQYKALATALQEKQTFSKAERRAFGVQYLRTNHTIKVDGKYFQPTNTDGRGVWQCLESLYKFRDSCRAREMAKDSTGLAKGSTGLRERVWAAKSTSCLYDPGDRDVQFTPKDYADFQLYNHKDMHVYVKRKGSKLEGKYFKPVATMGGINGDLCQFAAFMILFLVYPNATATAVKYFVSSPHLHRAE